jgi:hypothetical protein
MEATVDPSALKGAISVEPEALRDFDFYVENYERWMFPGLGVANKQIVLGTEPFVCRFCDGEPRSGHSESVRTQFQSFSVIKSLSLFTNAISATSAFLHLKMTSEK